MAQHSQVIVDRVFNKISGIGKILVGFSGGIDSTVLLHALYLI